MPAASRVEVRPAPVVKRLLRCEAERRKRGLSQVQVSKLVGTSQPRIAAIECGSARPGRSLALRLAKLFSLEKPEDVIDEVKS